MENLLFLIPFGAAMLFAGALIGWAICSAKNNKNEVDTTAEAPRSPKPFLLQIPLAQESEAKAPKTYPYWLLNTEAGDLARAFAEFREKWEHFEYYERMIKTIKLRVMGIRDQVIADNLGFSLATAQRYENEFVSLLGLEYDWRKKDRPFTEFSEQPPEERKRPPNDGNTEGGFHEDDTTF